ncbi:hypothetical protein HPB50_026031 [Hyalomma asiaticum]|uniref:Uncharacterized protein n=1 Tax=Hyalomma asiaticum TaxID=266040 RepID=A0ACB7TP91_HYAAI|nr:hypothetical protein HPB50_026031 [Hyalomma asiaticum]
MSRSAPEPLCSGPGCEAYAQLLREITNRSAEPCHDFHGYVCTHRHDDQPRSGKEHALLAFRKHVVAAAAESLQSTEPPFPPALTAARFYKLCEDILFKKEAETEELKNLLEDVGSEWPNLDRKPDLLKLVVRLSVIARWDMPLQVIADTSEDGGVVIRIFPSKNFETVMKIRLQLARLHRYKVHYHLLRESFVQRNTNALPFEKLQALENVAISSLRRYLFSSHSHNVAQVEWPHTSLLTPYVSTEAWNRTLTDVFGELTSRTLLRVENLAFFKALFELKGRIGEQHASWFFSWCAVMLVSSVTNSDAIANAYSNFEEALNAHRDSCFDMAHDAFGYAFYAPHMGELANPNARLEVSQINSHIRSTMGLIAAGWVLEDRATAFKASDPQKLYQEVFKSSPLRLQSAFAPHPNMTGKLTVDWRLAMEALDGSVASEIQPRFSRREWHDLIVAADGSYQITLMPYSMEVPLYHVDAPLALKYAGLGFQIAIALSSMLFSKEAFGSDKSRTTRFVSGARCLEADQAFRHSIVGDSYGQLLQLISLKTCWEALNFARDPPNSAPQSTLSGFSEAQAFFVVWCYMECGTRVARQFCNELLRHSPEFSRAFSCSKGDPMVACLVCSIPGEKSYDSEISDLCAN